MVVVSNGQTGKGFTNAHISYRDRSIIIDYEHCLHDYGNSCPAGYVPIEMFPYEGEDIIVGYVKLSSTYGKADIEDLIMTASKWIEEENL